MVVVWCGWIGGGWDSDTGGEHAEYTCGDGESGEEFEGGLSGGMRVFPIYGLY